MFLDIYFTWGLALITTLLPNKPREYSASRQYSYLERGVHTRRLQNQRRLRLNDSDTNYFTAKYVELLSRTREGHAHKDYTQINKNTEYSTNISLYWVLNQPGWDGRPPSSIKMAMVPVKAQHTRAQLTRIVMAPDISTRIPLLAITRPWCWLDPVPNGYPPNRDRPTLNHCYSPALITHDPR